MKITFLIFLLTLLVNNTYAQASVTSAVSPDLIVIKKKWRFQSLNSLMDESPFLALEERVQDEQAVKDSADVDNVSAKLGIAPIRRADQRRVERKDGHITAKYIYEVKLKNTGKKNIRTVTLDYLFFDLNTGQKIGQRRLLSKNNIDAGKTRSLLFHSALAPTGTINAKDEGKKSNERYFEQVIIQSIEYTDGSVWITSPRN